MPLPFPLPLLELLAAPLLVPVPICSPVLLPVSPCGFIWIILLDRDGGGGSAKVPAPAASPLEAVALLLRALTVSAGCCLYRSAAGEEEDVRAGSGRFNWRAGRRPVPSWALRSDEEPGVGGKPLGGGGDRGAVDEGCDIWDVKEKRRLGGGVTFSFSFPLSFLPFYFLLTSF